MENIEQVREDGVWAQFSMDEVARIVRAGGYFVTVEQTGGGCATLYAGGVVCVDEDGIPHYQIVGGPGSFGYGVEASRASFEEFFIGPDESEPNGEYCDCRNMTSAEQVAAEVLNQLNGIRAGLGELPR